MAAMNEQSLDEARADLVEGWFRDAYAAFGADDGRMEAVFWALAIMARELCQTRRPRAALVGRDWWDEKSREVMRMVAENLEERSR